MHPPKRNVKILLEYLASRYIHDGYLRELLYKIALNNGDNIDILWNTIQELHQLYSMDREITYIFNKTSHIYYLLTPSNITQLLLLVAKLNIIKNNNVNVILFTTYEGAIKIISKTINKLKKVGLKVIELKSLDDISSTPSCEPLNKLDDKIKRVFRELENALKTTCQRQQGKQLIITTGIPPNISYELIQLVGKYKRECDISFYYIKVNIDNKRIEMYKVV